MYKKVTSAVIGIFCTYSILSFVPAGKWHETSYSPKDEFINRHPIEEEAFAFPGAEGGGRKTIGGRGGKVIKVTSLEDAETPGTLRYAINQTGPRIVVFDVSGTIYLKSSLHIGSNDITIAGQTAPGGGICVAHYDVDVSADNVVLRYLRFRMGDVNKIEADALGGRFHKNIIIDHCSVSWSTDECVSFYQNENFTLQWCIISESLKNSAHSKGSHGYGGVWGGKNATFHHNLVASHDSRNPRLGEYANHAFALTDLVDLRNNVIYNWGGNSCYGGEAMNVNIVNCYYKPGPATVKRNRIIAIDKNTKANISPNPVYNIWGKYYINGNEVEGSPESTKDNWTYGVYNQFAAGYGVVSEADKMAIKQNKPHNAAFVTTHTAQKAYDLVLKFAGASLVRDAVDIRIINDVKTGKVTINDGGNGSKNGLIDSQSAAGGWPELASEIALKDTDNDGMPDGWEKNNRLNPEKNDANGRTLSVVYDNVEVYINSMAAKQTEQQLKL
ncbi:pectate lyase [Flavobacterium sp. CSZ]|uniref:pectate lyase family protein n=1 Tax=Flavobacterium sp. CSZ TaxID=2783791 RepID=UPI00188CD295|nr:pectate lyase [Flavobacterium sp. CSZ]MBF4485751.1 pectate lyase [Flavobacterium sp. CSZ]